MRYLERAEGKGIGFTWTGTLAGQEGSVLLTVTGIDVTGIIHLQNVCFSIEPLGQGLYALIHLDQSKFPPDQPAGALLNQETGDTQKTGTLSLPSQAVQTKQSETLSVQANPVIDILVVYTSAAASTSGNINSLMDGSTNNICANSSAAASVRRVYSAQVSYTVSGSLETDLELLQGNGDGSMDNVHTLRNQYGADIVVLLVATGNNCGLAYGVEVGVAGAFAVARTDCAVNNYSFAHEVGHLIGGRHDDPASTPRAYAHGYFNSISGPSLAPCATGTWTASVSNGTAPHTYQWYHMWDCNSNILVPCDTWNPVGTNSSTLQMYLCGGNSILRVDVTDGQGRFATDQHYVYGSGSEFASQSTENPGEIVVAVPEQLSLSQNFPNPFNPVTTISYKLPIDSYVTMKIYDVLGREVMTLVNDRLKAGSYETRFEASLLPSGVYVYRIEAVGQVKMGKLLLQK